ncbi:response regulator [Pseudomonas sp. HN11]|uniref:response regulator transcription factor n=1 Tax=Pseudomonas sp. HN11 TaxID=1344094 RepID=UPI001F2A6445|nr:response regulator [Pseudomonas sp. HN11]UII69250.1 response regulator [Pseudomonas sp. HN11]
MSDTKIIAIVDDDESVRMALDGLLRSNGYNVRLYADAEAFLASDGPGFTACLISDIQMPGLSGIQLHETLHAAGLSLPVIFITGYPGPPPSIDPALPPPIAFFPKPFSCAQLMACLADVLGR